MKKIIAIVLMLGILTSLVACRKNNTDISSVASIPEDTVSLQTESSPQVTDDDQGEQVEDNVSKTQSVIQNTVESTPPSKPQSTPSVPVTEPEKPVETPPVSNPSSSQPSVEKVYESTIDTPKEIRFYKDSMYGVSTDEKLNLAVAKCVEAWYKDYENNTLPLTKTAVDEEMIAKIKYNETVVEICFNYDQEINFFGKIKLEKTRRLLIPLTGDYAYYVFRGNSAYKYQSGLHHIKGASGLEKYFEHVTLDKEVNNWQSTAIAPKTVIFYKEGMQTESTDKEFNFEIVKYIESWFQYKESAAASKLSADTDLINEIKRDEMAIELTFDAEIKFYGGVVGNNVQTMFIPVTGKYARHIFRNTIKNPDYWSGPILGQQGLEQFFEGIEFTSLTEEQKRWRSTVNTASIEFYENGKLIDKSESSYADYKFSHKLSQHIESWFYKKENIETVTVSNTPLETAWSGETYIKMWFGEAPTFYGEQIIDEKHHCIIIPLTGDYAYHIFEGTYKEMSNVAINVGGSGLEQYFDELKAQ